jgi:signal recognition particle receptor subunit beta
MGTVNGIARTVTNYVLPLELNDSGYRIIMNASAIVFVVDSDPTKMAANRQAVKTLTNLEKVTSNIVVQYNKRDLPEAMPIQALSSECNPWNAKEIEAVASQGLGVLPTNKACLMMLLVN